MSEPEAIVWLCSWYPGPAHPLAGGFVARMAAAVAVRQPLHVLVVDDWAAGGPLVQRTEADGLTVWRTSVRPRGKGARAGLRYYAAYLLACRRLWAALPLSAAEVRLLHVHVVFPMGLFAYFLHHRTGLPYVITEHLTRLLPDRFSQYPFVVRRTIRRVAAAAAQLLPVGASLEAAYRHLGVNTPSTVVPNVVDPALFYPAATRADTFTFIHVSALTDAAKNVSGIIRAFHTFGVQYPATRLVIVGDGQDRKRLEYLAASGQVASRIEFLGQLSHRATAAELRRAHVLVIFSHYETFSVVLAEALACGLPVISTEHGGRTEWINRQTGRLVARGDEAALAAAMADIYSHYATFDTSAMRERVLAQCAPEAVARQILRVYTDVRP